MTEASPARQRGSDWQNNLPLLAILAFLPLIGAQFGLGNQVEQFSLIARILNPDLMPGDLYVEEAIGFGPRFYYVHLMAAIVGVVGLPVAVHALSVLCNFGLAAVSYAAAGRLLGASQAGCALAAILAVTNAGFSLGFAGFLRFDSFQPASVAVPLGLIGFYLTLRGQPVRAAGAFAAGSLMHPLIGVELAMFAYAAAAMAVLIKPSPVGIMRGLLPLIAGGALFGAFTLVAWGVPMVLTGGERMGNDEFFRTLIEFRAPHHYLGLDFHRIQWIFAAVFFAGIAVVYGLRVWSEGLSREVVALAMTIAIVVAVCLASLWFVDQVQSRLWATAQVFRITLVLKWAGFLILAWLLGEWIKRGGLAEIVLASIAVVATGDALSYVLVLVLAAKAAIELGRNWFPGRVMEGLIWLGLAVTAAISGYIIHRYGGDEGLVRAAVAMACAGLIFSPRLGRDAGTGLAVLLAAVVLVTTTLTRHEGLFGWDALKADFVWADRDDDATEIARAARQETRPDSVWLVPPDMEIFRVVAERTVVADFTSIPFPDMAMREWRQRIENLYSPGDKAGFAALREMRENYREGIDWDAAAETYGATHAILYADTPWQGPVLAQNETYKIVPLSP